LNELALFAGAGGGILGGKLLGWSTVGAVEIEPFCQGVLIERQNDSVLEPFPIWDDVRTFDGLPWRGIAQVVSGGFPCQDCATNSSTETGVFGTRSGLVFEMLRVIREVRPAIGLFENSPLLSRRGLEHILFALAKMGYDAKWGVLGAHQAGAHHKRERLWLVASDPHQIGSSGGDDRDAGQKERENAHLPASLLAPCPFAKSGNDIPAPWIFGGSDGLANGLDRVAALGNGQVPAVVRLAWETLKPMTARATTKGAE
jgi:DNA (cytosine-5)-methyltransferase 1